MSPPDKTLKITFFGHFGSRNFGNESTLDAILARLRSLYPDANFRCVCTNPAAVTARAGIEGTLITTRAVGRRPSEPRIVRLARALPAEFGQHARAFRALKGTDMFIVPGTGLMTDAFGIQEWGPYNLFKWVLAAKLRRARILFVSVGAGPFYTSAGRALVRASLSLADYRSYRDEESRDSVTAIGFPAHNDPVCPDLAFSLPEGQLPNIPARQRGARRVVGIGLIADQGLYSAADPRPDGYTAYLQSVTEFVGWLLDHGYDIRLLFGDGDGDRGVLDEFKALLRQRRGRDDDDRVSEQSPSSGDVLEELAQTDVVVATRFHNVLFSLLLAKPVIAITFHHKCSALMRQMKLSDYCHDIHQVQAEQLIAQFTRLEQNAVSVKRTIAEGVSQARAALDEQYDLLLEPRIRHARSTDVSPDPEPARRMMPGFLATNERVWNRLPSHVRDRRRVRAYGTRLHSLVSQRADREMYLGTYFLRNRPLLELMRRLFQTAEPGSPVRIAVLGSSIGVEVYSILWTLRMSRPDLEISVQAIDLSADAVRIGERGAYGAEALAVANWPIFDSLTEAEREAMFDWEGPVAHIKPQLREGITWKVGDAADPELPNRLGPHEYVVANNFLCHMPPASAESCLLNLAELAAPGGYLFVTGVDLDVRTKVATELGWQPLPDLRAEIHDGDPFVRADWPWRWWGLEPLDTQRPDWETRYSAAFRVPRPNPAT